MDPAVKKLVEANAPYFTVLKSGKIQCSLNKHELPAQLAPLQAFINGKKFIKLKTRKESEDLAKKYDPLIIQSRNAPEMLFCALTGQLIAKTQKAIKVHMDGQRFQRAKAEFEGSENQVLWTEPDLDEIRAEMEAEEAALQPDPDLVPGVDDVAEEEEKEEPSPSNSGQGDEELLAEMEQVVDMDDDEEEAQPTTTTTKSKSKAAANGKQGKGKPAAANGIDKKTKASKPAGKKKDQPAKKKTKA